MHDFWKENLFGCSICVNPIQYYYYAFLQFKLILFKEAPTS